MSSAVSMTSIGKENPRTMSDYEHISTDKLNGTLVLKFTTKHLRTPEVAHTVRDELINAVKDNQGRNLALDMEQVEFVGSVAMLAFLSLRRLADVERIVMCNVADNVKRIFVVCDLLTDDPQKNPPFEHAATVEEAVASIGVQPRPTT